MQHRSPDFDATSALRREATQPRHHVDVLCIPARDLHASADFARHMGRCEPAPALHDGCVVLGGRKIDHYPSARVARENRVLSQVVLEQAGSPRPSEHHLALHSCDFKACVRLEHLRWGTPSENVDDYITRRPAGRPVQRWARRPTVDPCGQRGTPS